MDRPIVASEVGQRLLDALGLGHEKNVTAIDIHISADRVVEVNITRAICSDAFGQLLNEWTPYTLVTKPEDPKAQAMETVAANLLKTHGGGSVG